MQARDASREALEAQLEAQEAMKRAYQKQIAAQEKAQQASQQVITTYQKTWYVLSRQNQKCLGYLTMLSLLI